MTEPLTIVLTIDAEYDLFDSSIENPEFGNGSVLGIREGIPLILGCCDGYSDSFGNGPKFTWYVRSDDQIGAQAGEVAQLYYDYSDLWRERVRLGDEVGFHPHLYRTIEGRWVQDSDPISLHEQTHRAFECVKATEILPVVSRIGEAFSSNSVMATIESLGISCDSTAMPGRRRVDGERTLDWQPTPSAPYFPSKADYRVPEPPPCYELLEIPMTMCPVKAHYDLQPISRYFDLSFRPECLVDGISYIVEKAEFAITVTHPSVVLKNVSRKEHGLLSFDIEAFRVNLERLIHKCEEIDRPYRFATMSECGKRVREQYSLPKEEVEKV